MEIDFRNKEVPVDLKTPGGPRRHFTYANVMSTLAVFLVVAGGTAMAAAVKSSKDIAPQAVLNSDVKKESLKSNRLKDGKAVKGADVIDDSLSGDDIDEATLDVEGGGPPVARPAAGWRATTRTRRSLPTRSATRRSPPTRSAVPRSRRASSAPTSSTRSTSTSGRPPTSPTRRRTMAPTASPRRASPAVRARICSASPSTGPRRAATTSATRWASQRSIEVNRTARPSRSTTTADRPPPPISR